MSDYILEGEILNIVQYPSKVLSKVAEPVTVFDDELKKICKNMLYTMYKAPGVGLAAPQVGISKRFFVMDVNYDYEKQEDGTFVYANFNPQIIINPKLYLNEDKCLYKEGCLSLPGIYEEVERYSSVRLEYQNLDGQFQELTATDLMAICIQHENDHLDGKVLLDRLSVFKKNFLKKKLIKKHEKN